MILKQIYLYPDLVEFNHRSEDRLKVQDQTRFIGNYLGRMLGERRIHMEDFNRICIIGYNNPVDEMYVNSCQVLSVPIAFNLDECLSMREDSLPAYYANLLRKGYQKAATQYPIPLDEMLSDIEEFRKNGYRNEWLFKERTFRQEGVKCSLNCTLTMKSFALRLSISKKLEVLFDDFILETAPDEICFQDKFKDIDFLNGNIRVLDRIKRVTFQISLAALSERKGGL